MLPAEAHSLQLGQHFTFNADTPPLYEVTDVGLIDYEGHDLVIYLDDHQALHGHYRDHTPVWIE